MLLARRNNNNQNWMTHLFDDFFDTDWMPRMNGTAPAVNVKENEKEYTMEIATPGLKKEYCRINVNDDGNLEIQIENKLEHKEEEKKTHYLRREFSYSNYEQSYALPENVDREHITAKVENGVLTIVMPKETKEEEKKNQRRIEVG